ncbi:macro domain-containing protein [Inquilinus sp. NPDC058860]|uniref:type II toxin-antitoxin system antitoxin DNA ADP-ribosyl glycohydrolase DarG n=1 Tax=Inquilinus sp. NPDC058860 TaxID=3346652 RepID=UPI0036821F3C
MRNITVKIGDMMTSRAQTLVNTVNCVGVMGKGIALAFKSKFPEMYKDYVDRCKAGRVRLGEPYLYKDLMGKWVLNFPTKDHWRAVSRISDIVEGLEYLEAHYREWGITSLAVPPLGCGNGQLDWNVVGPTLYRHLSRLEVPVELYAPLGTPENQLTPEFLQGVGGVQQADRSRPDDIRISAAAVALVGIVSRIYREPYHWPVGRTTFQKIAYFATEAGLPTGLEYTKGSYGPFSEGLKKLISRLVNNGLLTEEKKGNMFVVRPGPTYRDARDMYKSQLREWTPNVERVADLFLRIQSTIDAEIAASVHFAAKELIAEGDPTEADVLEKVREWKAKRNPPLPEPEVASSVRYLNALGWFNVRGSSELNTSIEEELFA